MPRATRPAADAGEVLSTRALNRALLARQLLLARAAIGVEEALARTAGLQAQLARPPFVGLWTRVAGFAREALVRAAHERRVVRATAMRATIHLLAADDFVAWRAALQPMLARVSRTIAARDARLLDDAAALAREGRAFFAGRPATFDALRAWLRERRPGDNERALAYGIRTLLPLVQVPTDARWGWPGAADFALADEWLGRLEPATGEALAHLVRRYLAAFGPATPRDMATWSGFTGLREAFEAMRPELVTVRDARGRELFDLPDAPRPPEDVPAPPRFVPDYDNLVLAHEDRARIVAEEHRPRITAGRNLQVRPVFLLDGMAAGTWAIRRKGRTASLLLEPFGRLTKQAVTALEEEGDALLRFAEEDAAVREMSVAR